MVNIGQRIAAQLRRRPKKDEGAAGLLSFVVPVYNVERYLDECLVSLREQQYVECEIVIVNDGTPDRSMDIARRHAAEDTRIRIVERPNGGLSAARNTGVAAATGEFLAFVDSDDVVPPAGYQAAVTSLQESGSDFAVLPYRRLRRNVVTPGAAWIREAHKRPRIGVNLDEFPEIQVNAIACSKVFRRKFWQSAELEFREGVIYEDQEMASLAYAKARAIDVLDEVLYHWRARDDFSSISQAKAEVDNLRAQFDAGSASLSVLREHASDRAREERARQLLSNDLPQFLRYAVEASDDFLQLAAERLPGLISELPEGDYPKAIPAQQKVLHHLIQSGQFDAARDFILAGGLKMERWEVGTTEDGPIVYLPTWRHPTFAVPDEAHLLARTQTEIWAQATGVAFADAKTARVTARAFHTNVDLTLASQQVRAFAVRDTPEAVVDLPLRQFRDEGIAELQLRGSSWYCDSRDGGVEIDIDLDALSEGDWRVRLDVAGPVSGTTLLNKSLRRSTARMEHVVSPRPGRIVTVGESEHGFGLQVRDGLSIVHDCRIHEDLLQITGSGPLPDQVELVAGPSFFVAERPRSDGSHWRVDFGVDGAPDDQPWTLTAVVGDVPLKLRDGSDAELLEQAGLTSTETRRGIVVRRLRESVRITGIELLDDGLRVEFSGKGLDLAGWELQVDRWTKAGLSAGGAPSVWTALLPTATDRWGAAGAALPTGEYHLTLVNRSNSQTIRPKASRRLLDRSPMDQCNDQVRVRLHVNRRGVPLVDVSAPLPPEVRGQRAQALLRRTLVGGTASADAVVFRCLYGEAANDCALAIHEELQRRGTELTCYWSVVDLSVTVPPGGVPLLEGSSEWFETLAGARYVVVNVHQMPWYSKPDGQVMVQTFHGYPYKSMGVEWWRRTGLPASRIESMLERARDWDYLVSPASYATPLLREGFFPDGNSGPTKILELGYPRNDVLLQPDEADVRGRTRRLLGIRDDQTAVLYAPTFRDEHSVDGMTAQPAHVLDVDALAGELGDDFVVLERGHAFHARAGAMARSAVDVTDYPRIADLCLAADVAVLDYSSLRFDFALTRKPMVFFVPDKDAYHRLRPAILPYEETAPGPHVTTPAQLVERLRDLASVRTEFEGAVEKFIATYMDLEDGNATRHVVDAIFGRSEGPSQEVIQ